MGRAGSAASTSPTVFQPKVSRPRAIRARNTMAVARASSRAAWAGVISRPSSSTSLASPGVCPLGSSMTSLASVEVSMIGCSRGLSRPRPTSQVSKASWLCSTSTAPRAKRRNARRTSLNSGAPISIERSIWWRRRAYGLMGARQSTSVSKNESGPSSRNRSAPISRTRKGALPVVSTSRATNCASSSGVCGPSSGISTAISAHSTGSMAPRGFSKTGFCVTWLTRALSGRTRSRPR
jgi:hypothetical protein